MHKLLKRIVTIMLALCLLVTPLPMAALAEDGVGNNAQDGSNADDAAIDVSDQVVYNNAEFFTYTGSPVSFSATHTDIKEWSYVYYDVNNNVLSAAPSAVGCYSVKITGKGVNCFAQITHAFNIIAAEIQYSASDYAGVYDGAAHSITVNVTTEGAAVTYAASLDDPFTETNPTFTDAGEYPVWYHIEKENYANVGGCATVTITKADVSKQVSFNGQSSYPYTGSPVSFTANCAGIDTWTYTYYNANNDVLSAAPSAVGSYHVVVSGEGKNHTARVTHEYSIEDTTIAYTASGYTGYYDGNPHTIALDVTTEGVTATYATSEDGTYSATLPSFTESGTYTVWFKLEKENYVTVIDSATVTIKEPGQIAYTASGFTGYYDGNPHTIALTVTTEGVTITYATSENGTYSATLPSFTDAGTYTVYYLLEKENCETVGGSATVTIAKADVSDRVTFNKKDAYDYTDNPVAFDPTCEGITSWSFTYYGKDGAKLSDAPSAPGSYRVEMSGEGANCIAKVTHAYAIDPATFEYTVKSYNGKYDGKAHFIMVSASMSDVVVTYATAKDGAYSETSPRFTDVGTYTVYFRLERTGFKTEEGSATITITRGDVSNRVTFNKKDTYACTGDPVAFNPTCEGITSWSFTYYAKNGAKLSAAPSKPGSYRVEISGEGANCYARVTHAYSISDDLNPDNYSVESYSGEYDGQPHSIRLNFDPDVLTTEYSVDGGANWQNNKPEFTNVGSYSVAVRVLQGSEIVWKGSASVTITKGTPQLYFTPGNIVFQPGEKSRQLEWVYTGDGTLYFTSSDSRHFWVDPSGGLVSLNQEGGVSIWVTASETANCKSVTAMCTVETESTLPQIDIDTKLEYSDSPTDILRIEAQKISSGKDNLTLYLDAKLFDPRDPQKKKELHNVRVNFTVPYNEIFKESLKPVTAYDFTVLHQRTDNIIEEVPFLPGADGLKICDTTLSPFAIVCLPKENYNLYYDVNGGTGTPLNQRVPMYGESYGVAVSSETPSRDGYTFMGWSMSRGGDVQFMPDDTITLDRDIILYAVWEEADTPVDLPQTGDSSHLLLWLVLLCLVLLCAWYAVWKCGAQKKTDEYPKD